MGDNNAQQVRRRQVLKTIGASAAVGTAGLSAFTGTAAAWKRQAVNFKSCSEVWFIATPADIKHDPPAVVRVVVASPNDVVFCRNVEITQENTTTTRTQYGYAPVRKVTVDDDEKVLGVIYYNYDKENRFSSPACIITNDNDCAMTESTPSVEDAICVQDARENDGYDCEGLTIGSGQSAAPDSSDERPGQGGSGLPYEN